MVDRTAHPSTCRGCRHDVRIEHNWTPPEIAAISGWCGRGYPWGKGCPQFAEPAPNPARQRICKD
jgi:hypothetical protein